MAEVDRWSIDRLDLSNWVTWKFQIKNLLLVRGLWGLVDGMEVLQAEANAQQQVDQHAGFLVDLVTVEVGCLGHFMLVTITRFCTVCHLPKSTIHEEE